MLHILLRSMGAAFLAEKRLMRLLQTATMAALAVFSAGSAMAHAKLISATPAVNGTVSGSPAEIRIGFSEGIVAKLSGVVVTTASGAKAATGPASTAPGDDKQMVVPVKAKLAAGAYTVAWHAVSTDTHRVQGKYSFTVK
jgi:methionine-rich copper-binding protein CopC